jgi:hypothetical protein
MHFTPNLNANAEGRYARRLPQSPHMGSTRAPARVDVARLVRP